MNDRFFSFRLKLSITSESFSQSRLSWFSNKSLPRRVGRVIYEALGFRTLTLRPLIEISNLSSAGFDGSALCFFLEAAFDGAVAWPCGTAMFWDM